jgi:hypothetical protein
VHRLWQRVTREKPTTSTRINGKPPDNTNGIYPKRGAAQSGTTTGGAIMISSPVRRGLRMAVVGALAAGVLVGCGTADAVVARSNVTANDRQATDSTTAGGTSSGGASETPPIDDWSVPDFIDTHLGCQVG